MVTTSKTVGSGGDYATIAAWQTARRTVAVSGDVEECILLDSPNTEAINIPNSQWANGVKLRIKGNIPLDGTLNTGIVKTTGQWFFHSDSSTNKYSLEVEDLIFSAISGAGNLIRAGTYGGSPSGLQLNDLSFSSIIVTNEPSYTSLQLNLTQDSVNNVNPWYINFYNVLGINCSGSSNGISLISYGVSSPIISNFQGCTFKDTRLRFNTLGANSSQIFNIGLTGCMFYFSSLTSVGEFARGGAGTSLVSSLYCITSRSQAQHESLFNSYSGINYSTSFVEGEPASGQVGFQSITNNYFSLYDSPNNLASNYVLAGTMPSTDIVRWERPQQTYPAAGAFEIPVYTTFTTYLPISVISYS